MTKPKRYDNRPWRKLYNRKRWKALRAYRLQQEPLCRRCKSKGRDVVATVCDHIIPHRGDIDLFHDYANTQSLCKLCHDKHKQREEIGALEAHEFGADGYPISGGGL